MKAGESHVVSIAFNVKSLTSFAMRRIHVGSLNRHAWPPHAWSTAPVEASTAEMENDESGDESPHSTGKRADGRAEERRPLVGGEGLSL
jgi:hypothetical protein